MSVKIEKVLETGKFTEGPHWDDDTQTLYFVSMDGFIHRFVPATGEHTQTQVGIHVSFVIPVEGAANQFIVAVEATVRVVEWDGAEGSTVRVVRDFGAVEKEAPEKYRLNDAKADPRGRVFTGSYGVKELNEYFETRIDGPKVGKIYGVDNERIKTYDSGIGLSNGIAWDSSAKKFYYIDSLERNIRSYDYDVDTGEISNLKYIFDLKKNGVDGIPDGATMDVNDNLWVAVYEGGCVIQIDPKDGRLLSKVDFPDLYVTSVTFGGPEKDTLYVTTGSAKAIYAITGLGVKGSKNLKFRLN